MVAGLHDRSIPAELDEEREPSERRPGSTEPGLGLDASDEHLDRGQEVTCSSLASDHLRPEERLFTRGSGGNSIHGDGHERDDERDRHADEGGDGPELGVPLADPRHDAVAFGPNRGSQRVELDEHVGLERRQALVHVARLDGRQSLVESDVGAIEGGRVSNDSAVCVASSPSDERASDTSVSNCVCPTRADDSTWIESPSARSESKTS